MPILAGDIKLVESQVMDDVPEGGGAPTAAVVVDATQNNLFNDVSELDRAIGRVNLRKVFVRVATNDRAGYYGANVIVADPPDDDNVNVAIFTTARTFDTRAEASSRVEAYLNAGPEWPGFLYEAHITGQRSVQIMTRVGVALPPIGRTLLLRMNEGAQTEFEQYVRTTRVDSEERTFTDPVTGQDYKALVVTCDISDALRFDFPGTAASKFFNRETGKTKVRDTVVADAATYCGAVATTAQVDIGDAVILADGIHTQLVPSSRTETSVLDQRPSADYVAVIATSPRRVEVPGAPLAQRIRIGQENRGFNYVTLLTPLPAPGSLRITYRALGVNYSIPDNGDGTLGGASSPGTGTINYLTGSVAVTLKVLPDDRSAVVFYWGQNVAYTNRAGSVGFRAPEFSFSLDHTNIVPGSLEITWDSGGTTKTATDNGTGKFTGDAVGEVVYATGMVALRPIAMLSGGGQFSIAYDWVAMVEEAKPGLSPDGSGAVSFTFGDTPVPGTVCVEWLTTRNTSTTAGSTSASGSANKSSMANSSAVNTTETTTSMVDTTKTYRKWTPEVAAAYNAPKEETTVRAINPHYPYSILNIEGYEVTTREPVTTTTSHSESGGVSASTKTGATYSTAASQASKSAITLAHVATDDGAGKFFGTLGTLSYVGKTASIKVQGDYSETSFSSNFEDAKEFESLNSTSESTTTASGSASTNASDGGGGSNTSKGGSYGSSSQAEVFGAATLVVRYQTGTPSPSSHTQTYQPPGVSIDLCPTTTDIIVPGSVRFTWMGTVYEDFEGLLYRGRTNVDPGIIAGGLNYVAGQAAMSDYVVSGSPTAFALDSLWTRKAREHVANMVFSTSLGPVKPTGLVLSVLDTSGTQLIGTANLGGDITGTHIHGKIDYESGLCEVQFGDYVLDSGLSAEQKAEWWYDAGEIRTSDSKIWRPWPIDPETLRYNFVSYFYLPLDAGVLGIDPVRLPQDGRVPIFRPGGVLVIGHTATVPAATYSNGNVIDCARVRLSRVRLIGHNGAVIDTGYTADLEAGEVTVTDIAGWSQPVTVEHRIEDMAMVSEVQINGRLSLTRQITHEYPVGAIVSSALIAGDLRARTQLTFDQVTWTNVWQDSPIGSPATATFDTINNPITVTNGGALTERWAVVFTNTTSFNVVGEHLGVMATGNTSADCAPLNPASGTPYFNIPALGWGSGWATGNVLRFNTIGAFYPVWVVRTIQQGPETAPNDSFALLVRGDVDNPAP